MKHWPKVNPDTVEPSSYVDYRKLGHLGEDLPFRTMILKNNDGDIGLCFAKWVGFSLARGRIKKYPRRKYSAGCFKFWFYDLKNKTIHEVSLNDFQDSPIVKFWNKVEVNFVTGIITVPANSKSKIVKSVGLALAVSVLYLLVQPRPVHLEANSSNKFKENAPYFSNENVLLLNCAGWQISEAIPSNANLRKATNDTFGFGKCGGCGGCGSGCFGGNKVGTSGGDVGYVGGASSSNYGGWDGGGNGGGCREENAN